MTVAQIESQSPAAAPVVVLDAAAEAETAAEPEPAPVAAPQPVPALIALTSTDTADTASDSVLSAVSDTAAAQPVAPADGWLPGASGLLVPQSYAGGDQRPALIVPGRPAPVPGPRPVAPATPRGAAAKTRATRRTASARTGSPARTQTQIPAPRTESADAPRTERPARTDVVAELAAAIRTDAAWRPDYEALMGRTGYQRSFLEKCVRDARDAAKS